MAPLPADDSIFQNPERAVLAIASGIMLALSYPNFNISILGWVCFIPLLVALQQCSLRQAYLLGLLSGFTGISIGFYWISNWAYSAMEIPAPFHLLFIPAFAFLFGQMFGGIAILFHWLRMRTRWDDLIIFPLVLVTLFTVFPLIFPFRLGDSQWQFLTAIQPIDITGVYGLDFVMALTNTLGYKLLTTPRKSINLLIFCSTVVFIIGWFAVGWLKLSAWEEELPYKSTRKLGLVQPNRPATLSLPQPEPGYSRAYPLEMELSEQLAQQGAEVLIWPEGHFFGYTFWQDIEQSFKKHISGMAVPLLFYDATRRPVDQKEQAFNTILHLDNHGDLVDRYDKIKLVPFSEYLPIFGNSALFDWIPGDYLDNLTPGKETKIFSVEGMRIVPRTCYEPLFPEFVASSIGSDAAGKVILVQSQDGWFGQTSQPYQHMAATVMRAVENRVPVIHVIQNGPSGVIRPTGSFAFISKPFVRGHWLVELPFHPDQGGSFFAANPRLFICSVMGLCCLAILISLFKGKTKHQ